MFAVTTAFCLMSAAVYAADPSGTWKWTEQSRGRSGGDAGAPREVTLNLAVKDGNVTGKISRPGRDGAMATADISGAALKGDMLTFSFERQYGDNKFVTKYSGRISGDTITGTAESPGRGGGEPTKREWIARRSK